ncbi:hypothetical protein JMJ35_004665 [Cladonia borealis]|uniref:CRIB domain-containing protein n=1 Tax=Cladonia borealis TaxID=184061 RepID=A0AA39R3G4_9LECA|nr:hypothetical protein JMJ35_004665 [Cladonia borealis]
MFEHKGTMAADPTIGRGPDWRVTDYQNNHRRSFTPKPTLHQRALTEDVRRPHLLQKRSRSNTSIASLTPLTPREGSSLSPAISIDRSTSNSSSDRRSVSGSIHARNSSTDSFGKTLMAKGSRLLRRQNSKQELTSLHTLDWLSAVDGPGHVQEMSARPGSRQSRIQSRVEEGSPRYNISEPFNFQHLTHTTPNHVKKIEETNSNDLVSEFSAIRAAQAPRRELQGIKTVEIQKGGFYYEASGSETSSPPQTGYGPSPPRSPHRSHEQGIANLHDVPSPIRSFHHPSRSIESFSQPSPRRRSQLASGTASPTSPPPRSSSRNATAPDFFTFRQLSPTHPSFEPRIHEPLSQPLVYPSATWNQGDYDPSLPHAVTTPDDSAHSLRPLPFSMIKTELSGVPEEDETAEGRRSSIVTLARSTTPTLRHAKSFPSSRMSPQRWSGTLPPPCEDNKEPRPRHSTMSFGLEPSKREEHTEDIPERPQGPRRVSGRMDDSWEEVIDYCYEHEAEADCNFEWTHVSPRHDLNSGPTVSVESAVDGVATAAAGPSFTLPGESFAPPNPTLMTSLPDLEPPSAISTESSFSSIREAVTPSYQVGPEFSTNSSKNSKPWTQSSNAVPLVVPSEESPRGTPQDDLYNQILSSEFQLDNHFPWIFDRVAGSTISNSPRSSRSQISKSSSQESFRHSQALSIAQQRRQRNASDGSLPELVSSKTSRERVDSIVEKLTEHVSTMDTADLPVVPVPAAMATSEQRRRNSKLAKEVALKSIISRALTEEDVPEVPLPLHPAFRQRLDADSSPIPVDVSVPLPPMLPQGPVRRRIRSTSSTSSLNSPRHSRASYSLFPINNMK